MVSSVWLVEELISHIGRKTQSVYSSRLKEVSPPVPPLFACRGRELAEIESFDESMALLPDVTSDADLILGVRVFRNLKRVLGFGL